MFRGLRLRFPHKPFAMISTLSMLCGLAAVATWVLFAAWNTVPESGGLSGAALRKPTGFPQLVSVEPLPTMDGQMCQWVPASASMSAALRQEQSDDPSGGWDRAPIRTIHDSYPTFSAVTVDVLRDEIILQDENLFQILIYDRTANTPAAASMTEPKRVIGGPRTGVEFNCGLYVNPKNGEIYSVTNDTKDTLVIFPREARGNMSPSRELHTPHGTFGIAVDEQSEEMFLTVQHSNSVVAYRRMAVGEEKPLRTLAGPSTQLEDPHGITLDPKNGWLFVSNHGNARNPEGGIGPGGVSWGLLNATSDEGTEEGNVPWGKFEPPSITVYPLDADGNTAPLRIIEGPRTRLNWPSHLYYDPDQQELFVANDADNSILVFSGDASGNAAPIRVIQGPRTGIRNPTGVFVDTKNQELVVSNMGNHTATVYPLDADGDVAPLRTIRAGPLGKVALAIGNPGAVAFDPKRQEILVPN